MDTNIAIIENIKYENDYVVFKGYALNRLIDSDDNIEKQLIIKNKNKDVYCKKIKNTLRTDITYIYRNDNKNYNMSGFEDIVINFNELKNLNGKNKLYIRQIKNDEINDIPLSINVSEQKNKLRKRYYLDYKVKKVLRWKFKNNKYLYFIIEECNRVGIIKHKYEEKKRDLRQLKNLFKHKKYNAIISLTIYKLIGWYLKRQDIWLIGEREDTAQDNSYHLFKYIVDNYKDINIYYVIDKKSKDYSNINKYKNIIQWGSLKHTVYLLSCKYSINSYSEKPNMYTDEYKDICKVYPYIINRKKIFLQHGVIATSRINHTLHKNKSDLDLFIVSSSFEKKHIVKEFGYTEKEVVITGLARWDNLNIFNSNRSILLMPTWRSWIKSAEELEESKYFKRYISLLTNAKLINILDKYNYTLIFYPHYHMQKLINSLDIKFDKRIQFVTKEKNRVQSLLKGSSILITDYSSVAFDFAYMKKPVVFYQFDYKDFYSKHYNEGPINHNKDLFGEVIQSELDLIKSLKNLCENSIMNLQDELKTNKFIEYRDNKNCKRIVQEIINLK